MRQRGRKSAEALAVRSVIGKGPRLEPPASLSEAERSVFVGLVTACDPDHFRASDLPLLVRYTASIVLGDRAALELRKGAVVKASHRRGWPYSERRSKQWWRHLNRAKRRTGRRSGQRA